MQPSDWRIGFHFTCFDLYIKFNWIPNIIAFVITATLSKAQLTTTLTGYHKNNINVIYNWTLFLYLFILRLVPCKFHKSSVNFYRIGQFWDWSLIPPIFIALWFILLSLYCPSNDKHSTPKINHSRQRDLAEQPIFNVRYLDRIRSLFIFRRSTKRLNVQSSR